MHHLALSLASVFVAILLVLTLGEEATKSALLYGSIEGAHI
jgi:hypothetical protein